MLNWGYLGNREASNGDPGNDVGFEEGEAVIGGPLENGEEKLEPQNQPSQPRLVLELVEGVVGEEDLGEAVAELLRGGFRRREADSVHLLRRRHLHYYWGFEARRRRRFGVWEVVDPVRVHAHYRSFTWRFRLRRGGGGCWWRCFRGRRRRRWWWWRWRSVEVAVS